MSYKNASIRLVVVALAWLAAGIVVADDSTSFLSMFKRKSKLSEQPLELQAEHGPWLILAATLTGDDAAAKANALAQEIRTKMRLPSFIMHKALGAPETLGVGERIRTSADGQLVPTQLKVKYANSVTASAYAVLVGEFTSTDDPRIPDTLHAIRVAQPAALGASGKNDGGLVQKTRKLFWWQSSRDENLKKGPMGAAFVTRNPLLPDDFFQAPKVDEFVAKLNKQVKYSLLDCPGRFTVRVASFHGQSVTDFGNGKPSDSLASTTDQLDAAASKANKLTHALRAKGKEAYQFHDRYGSYVMVGSFNDLGQELSPGNFQYNPAMLAIMKELCGYRVIDVKDPRTGAIGSRTSLKSLERIPFDVDGKPMAVPRPETNNVYKGSLLGRS